MNLKEILQKLVDTDEPILLCENNHEWEAGALLHELSEPKLKVNAFYQSGMYIAEIDPRGYMGRIIYRIKQKI